MSKIKPARKCPDMCPSSPSLRKTIPLTPADEDRTSWPVPYALLRRLDCDAPQNFARKLETGVKNGDCLPACFAAIIECLNQGKITSEDLEPAAARIRLDLITWIKANWMEFPVFLPTMRVHEIMRLQHDMGITPDERERLGDWGEDPAVQLEAYSAQCDNVYFSDAEMLLFASWFYDKRDMPLLFRIYRCSGYQNAVAQHVVDTPDPDVLRGLGLHAAIVVEMDHSGIVDESTAHYKLIAGGSLDALTDVKRASFKTDGPPGRRKK